uniref:Uncharacterized protein n=1 Tax=Astyanax mexicanus TaxID=7994 RepID=W5LCR7_ASTMX
YFYFSNSIQNVKTITDSGNFIQDLKQFGLCGGSLLASPFLKGFLAGYVVSKLRASAILGVALGTLTGIYAAQTYQVPNIEKTVKDYLNSLKKGPGN